MALSPIKTRYNDLKEFFQWWLPLYLPGKEIYMIGQSAPRPPRPYIAFNPIVNVEFVGNDERRFDPVTGNETLRGQRLITCAVFGYSDSETRYDGGDNAWEMLQELRFSFRYPDVAARLSSINCRIVEEGDVLDTSQNLNTTNEPQAQLQFELSTVIVQDIDNGAIETINAEGTIKGPHTDIVSNISVSKP